MFPSRKDTLENARVVSETAGKLRSLVQTASGNMFGIPSGGAEVQTSVSSRAKLLRTTHRRQPQALGKPGGGGVTSGSDTSSVKGHGQFQGQGFNKNNNNSNNNNNSSNKDANNGGYPFSTAGIEEGKFSTRKSHFQNRLMAMSRLNERSITTRLTQSTMNMINVMDPHRHHGKMTSQMTSQGDNSSNNGDPKGYDSDSAVRTNGSSFVGSSLSNYGNRRAAMLNPGKKKVVSFMEYNDEEYRAVYANGGLGSETEDEEEGSGGREEDGEDWRKVMRDSIEVLTDICDTLVSDRSECLRIIGVSPHQVSSLVEAVSGFIKERNSSGSHRRKEVERRLHSLEAENKNLLSEMQELQETLADKNNDAMNLQVS